MIALLAELSERFPERGFGKLSQLIRRRGLIWSHKRVWRVYCLVRLNQRRRRKKRRPNRYSMPWWRATRSMRAGRLISCLMRSRKGGASVHSKVIDDFSSEALAIEADLNLPATRVVRTLERIAAWRGYPGKIYPDNGPELIALTLAEWAERKNITLDFIEPGRSAQNGFVERFNGSFRRDVLYMRFFRNLTEVREQAEHWLADYSAEIPRDCLGRLTPAGFRQYHEPDTSNLAWH